MKDYPYPKECFSINESNTKNAKAEYERKYDAWYKKAEEMYPNYHDLDLRERLKVRDIINKVVGYSV